jgi:mRNA interferase RelE/StbE
MVYQLFFHPIVVEKHIPKLGTAHKSQIRKAIESKLTQEPHVFGKPLRNSRKGLWSLRVGDHRVIYMVHKDTVTVVAIGHRSDIYSK